MNNRIINQWGALLAFIAGMMALPWSDTHAAAGDNKSINTTGTITEAGKTYLSNATGYSALQVNGAAGGVVYNGSNIVATGTADSGDGRYGLYIYNGATAYLTSSTFASTGTANGAIPIRVSSSGTLYLQDARVASVGWNAHVIQADSAGSVILSGDIDIETSGSSAIGLLATGTGSIINTGSLRVSTSGNAANAQVYGFMDLGTSAYLHSVAGNGLLANGGTAVGINTVIVADVGYGIRMTNGSHAGAYVYLKDADITSGGAATIGVVGGAQFTDTLILEGGSVTATNGDVIASGTASGGEEYSNIDIIFKNGTTVDAGSGNLINNSGSTMINFSGEDVDLTGNITGSGSSTTRVSLDNSTMVSDITQGGDSRVVIELNNGSSGTGGFSGGDLKINDSNSRWNFNQDSRPDWIHNDGTADIGSHTVTTGSICGNGTWIVDVDTDTGGHGTIVTGTSSGDQTVIVDTHGGGSANPGEVLPGIVEDGSGNDNWSFQNPIDWGLDEVIVGKDGNGNWVVERIAGSQTAAVLMGGAVIQQHAWFAQQHSLLKRMGELRFDAADAWARGAGRGGNGQGNTWLRAYGQRLNVEGKVTGQPFKQMVYGVDAGADHAWTIGHRNTLWTGVYLGCGAGDADFRHIDGEVESDSVYGGFYLSWLNAGGWHADLTLKAACLDNDLRAGHVTAGNRNWGVGGSLEVGRRLDLDKGWFLEPQLQANYLRLIAEDYTTSNQIRLRAGDMDAWQLRAGTVLGRAVRLAGGGAFQPYARLGVVQMLSDGGDIRNGTQHARPNLDGARAELGLGVVWQAGERNQLRLDYEAGFGEKYDKPWGLTAGFRHQF